MTRKAEGYVARGESRPTNIHIPKQRNNKMKVKAITVMVFIWLLLLVIDSRAQIMYSSWASTQIRHAVETEKPVIKFDTVRVQDMAPFHLRVTNTFTYNEFVIEITKIWNGIQVIIYSGQTQVMLRPDDEYAILEKLIPLTR